MIDVLKNLTVDQLKTGRPDLFESLRRTAINAERGRLLPIVKDMHIALDRVGRDLLMIFILTILSGVIIIMLIAGQI